MTIYYVILILSLLFLLPSVSEKEEIQTDDQIGVNRERMRTGFFFFSLMLMFVAGFRYYVGGDFGMYYRKYQQNANKLMESIRTLNEPILPLIDYIGNFFVKDNIGATLFPAVITIYLISRTTYKYSTDLFFSSMLVLFTCWSSCFNGVRQALAAAILYCGYPYLRDRKLAKYGTVVFIAFLCHKSAIVMLAAYFVCKNEVSAKNVILLVIGSLIVLFSYDKLFAVVDVVLDKEYDYENFSYITRAINPLRVAIHLAPACYYLLKYWSREKTQLQTLCLNFVIIRAVMMIAASGSAMLGRIGMYTSTMCLIAIPELNRGLDKNTRSIMKWLILGVYCFVWLYELSGSSSTNNFRFVWQR